MLAFVVLPALGLALVLGLVYSAARLWRSVRRGVASLPRWVRSLTVEPSRGAFNDSRDVWSMPTED